MNTLPHARFDLRQSNDLLQVSAKIGNTAPLYDSPPCPISYLPDIKELQTSFYERVKRRDCSTNDMDQDFVHREDRRLGTQLLNILLQNEGIKGAFQYASQDNPLGLFVIELNLPPEVKSSGLPWEACAYANWNELNLLPPRSKVVIVRTPNSATQEWTAIEPIKFLVAGASPRGVAPPNFDKEIRAIETSLKNYIDGNRFKITAQREASLLTLNQTIQRLDPHVLHLISHGHKGHFQVEGSDMLSLSIDGIDLIQALGDNNNLNLFVTTACLAFNTPDNANALGIGDILSLKVPLSVGMQLAITSETAEKFSAAFYGALAISKSVLQAYAHARDEIRLQGKGSPEWIAPVLIRGVADYENKTLFYKQDIISFLRLILSKIDDNALSLRKNERNQSGWGEIKNVLNDIDSILIDGYYQELYQLSTTQRGTLEIVIDLTAQLRGEIVDIQDMLSANNTELRLKYSFGRLSANVLGTMRKLRNEIYLLLKTFV